MWSALWGPWGLPLTVSARLCGPKSSHRRCMVFPRQSLLRLTSVPWKERVPTPAWGGTVGSAAPVWCWGSWDMV
eukprot:15114096-Alexandrium_andersonii.AAC.1